MSEPRWHDADPRPPYGGVPGPEIRSARETPEPATRGRRLRGHDRPAAWEGPGWYRDDSDPFSSVEMVTGPGQVSEPDDEPRRVARPRAGQSRAPSWRWGDMPGGRGLLIVVAAAVLGAVATVVTKTDPGGLLGWCIVVGTLIAGFAVRPRAAYLLIPMPALAYVVFALAAGLVRNTSSGTGLTVSAAQWIANGFLTMAAATVLAVVVALGRWSLDRRAGASPAGRRRARPAEPAAPGGRAGRERAGRGRAGSGRAGSGRSARDDESDGFGRGSFGQGGGSRLRGPSDQDRGGRAREEAPAARPRPAFYPNPDWPGDRDGARDPRDRRPPPGPPSFGASRDLGHRRVSGG